MKHKSPYGLLKIRTEENISKSVNRKLRSEVVSSENSCIIILKNQSSRRRLPFGYDGKVIQTNGPLLLCHFHTEDVA